MSFLAFQRSKERYAKIIQQPLKSRPANGEEYWRLTESGLWLYSWSGDSEDEEYFANEKAFKHEAARAN